MGYRQRDYGAASMDQLTPAPAKSQASPLRWLITGLLTLGLLALAIALYLLNATRTESLKRVDISAAKSAELAAQAVSGLFAQVDLTLQAITDEAVRQYAEGGIREKELGSFIQRHFQRMPDCDSIRVSSPEGVVSLGSGTLPTKTVTITERDYFVYLRDHPDAGMIITKPIIGKISGKWVITCVRRVTLPDARFGGVVFAALTLDKLNSLLGSIDTGEQGSISLWSKDFSLITRYASGAPEKNLQTAGTIPISDEWRRLLNAGQRDTGRFTITSIFDGVNRTYTYKRIAPYDLYVNVGVALDKALSEYQPLKLSVTAFFLSTFIGSLLFIWLLQRQWRANLHYQHSIQKSIQEWLQTFDAISDSVSLIDADQRIIRCNRATSELLGKHFSEIVGEHCWKLFHGSDAQIADCPMAKAKESRHPECALLKTGDRWLEVKVDPIFSAASELRGAVHLVRDVTERESLAEALRELNELFALFMKHSPIYMFIKEVTDSGSRVLQASDNYIDMVGISAREMIGKSMEELFPPEFSHKITRDDQAVVSGGTTIRLEEELNNRHYLTYKFPILTKNSKSLLAGYTIDITDLKHAEEQVRENSLIYETILMTAIDGFWMADFIGRLLSVNDAYVALSGYSREELLSMKISDLEVSESTGENEDHLRTLVESGRDRYEGLHRRKDGTTWYVEVSSTFSEMKSGVIFTFIRDISWRKSAEESLRKSRELLAATAKAAKMGGWEIELPSMQLSWTDEIYQIYGVDRNFVPTVENTLAYYAPESLPIISGAVDRALHNGEPFDLELILVTAAGRRRLVHAVGRPEYRDGTIAKVIGTFQDIHDQRSAEEEVKRMQAQVIQQEKLASIGQLAAGVAHEINNPVGFVKSNLSSLDKYIRKLFEYLRRLQEDSTPYLPKTANAEIESLRRSLKIDFICEDLPDLLRESIEGINRVQKIVADLVSYARTAPEQSLPISVNDVLTKTIDVAWNEIKYKAELLRDFKEVPAVLANSQKLQQVFLNLIMNALHALPELGGRIEVTTRLEGDNVCVTVADNGHGIPEAIMARIFDPFFTTKAPGKGTGLGLAISSEIVTGSGGTIEVESEVGIGTTFTVRLPVEGSGE